jgi:hypothetical protein
MSQNAVTQNFHPRNRHERRHPPKATLTSNQPLTNSLPLSESGMPKLHNFDPSSTASAQDAMNMMLAMSTPNGNQTNLPPELGIGGSGKSAAKPRADKYARLEEKLYALLASAAGALLLLPALRNDGLIIIARAPGLCHAHVEVAKVYPEYYKFLDMMTSGSVVTGAVIETATLILMLAAAHGFKIPGIEKLLAKPEKDEPQAQRIPIEQLPPEDQSVRAAREQVFGNWRAMNAEMDLSAVP